MSRFPRSPIAPPTLNDRTHYFVWLDVLRGLAALSVLIWHYQHFYYTSAGASTLTDRSIQPFFNTLQLLYTHGAAAVELFWAISGFVFANIYTARVAPAKAREFILHRLARLYPLHFVTLIAIAILQLYSMYKVGHYQIYPHNDLYHFVLNLGFASSWGLERGYSFNNPIWSVSTEILIYAVFFISIPYISTRPLLAPLIVAFFLLLVRLHVPGSKFWLCGTYFFLGSFIFKLWQILDSNSKSHPALTGLICFILAMWAPRLASGMDPDYSEEVARLIAFPSLVLIAASLDRLDVTELGSSLRFVGDLTYGIYLWHIPVQVLALIIIEVFAFDRAIVSSEIFFMMFLSIVFVISYLSFYYIERPSRRAMLIYLSKVSSHKHAPRRRIVDRRRQGHSL